MCLDTTLKNVAFGKHKNIVDQVALSSYCDGCGELFKYNNFFEDMKSMLVRGVEVLL